MTIDRIIENLRAYDGKPLTLMEVCGTHTASIAQNGLRSLLSRSIKLVSGPGCPVCVTPASYIDSLCAFAQKPNTLIATFGDMLKVPGTNSSLTDARAEGAQIVMVYSPLDVLKIAEENPNTTVCMAAVGFETTAPSYALLMKRARERGIRNVKLLTAIKRMLPVLTKLCAQPNQIDGFIAPGHVSAILGSDAFVSLGEETKKPFAIAGFGGEDILRAIYELVEMVIRQKPAVLNLYSAVVRKEGNKRAQHVIEEVFDQGDAVWRGLGKIDGSGLLLNAKYADIDAGSIYPAEETMAHRCSCKEVLLGQIQPRECPLFGKTCLPSSPVGPCMVSPEGACGIHYWYEQF